MNVVAGSEGRQCVGISQWVCHRSAQGDCYNRDFIVHADRHSGHALAGATEDSCTFTSNKPLPNAYAHSCARSTNWSFRVLSSNSPQRLLSANSHCPWLLNLRSACTNLRGKPPRKLSARLGAFRDSKHLNLREQVTSTLVSIAGSLFDKCSHAIVSPLLRRTRFWSNTPASTPTRQPTSDIYATQFSGIRLCAYCGRLRIQSTYRITSTTPECRWQM